MWFCLQKCVLYWPERRGIYGRVEVLVSSVRECEHYTTRRLTLKVPEHFLGSPAGERFVGDRLSLCAVRESNPRAAALLVHVMARP